MENKRLNDSNNIDNPSSKKARLDNIVENVSPRQIDVKIDFFPICSVFHGKHLLPRAIGLRFHRNDNQEIKTYYINPDDFIPSHLDDKFVRTELDKTGYNEDNSILTFHDSIIGENITERERLESVSKISEVLPELLDAIKAQHIKSRQSIILNFVNGESKNFFLSLFRRAELTCHEKNLLAAVEEIVYDGEVSELLTTELIDEIVQPIDVLTSQSTQVFVDAVMLTYENEDLDRYAQLTHLGGICHRNDQAFSYDSEVMPIILNEPIDSNSRKKLSDHFKVWRQEKTNGQVYLMSEQAALSGFCSFLQNCCSCKDNASNPCNINLVTFSNKFLMPLLLSKVKEYNLESDFFRHIHKQAEVVKLGQKQIPKTASHCQLSGQCQLIRSSVENQLDRIDHLARPVTGVLIDKSELKCSAEMVETLFVGDLLPIVCEVLQSSQPLAKTSLTVTFSSDNASAVSEDDLWKTQSTSAMTCKVIFLSNFGQSSLSEIQPKPKGNWTHTRYSVSDGTEVSNGVANVFNGQYIVVERKKGFLFNGQHIGVCHFVRPSVGKAACSPPCFKQFSLNPSKEFILCPDSMSVITAHVVGSDSDLAACVNAGHMFKTTKVGIPEMVVINGVSIANPKMQFTVRNLSENELELFPYENMLQVTCCFNSEQFPVLLSNYLSEKSVKFFQNWSSADHIEGSYSQPSNYLDNDDDDIISIGSSDVEGNGPDPIGDVKNEDKERSPDIHEGDVHDGDGLGNGDGLKEEDEIEVINQVQNGKRSSSADPNSCKSCSNLRKQEKCPVCPDFVVKLTDIYDEYGLCVAKITLPESTDNQSLKCLPKKIRWVKFFCQDSSIMCPFISEVVNNEFLLVSYVNIEATEESLSGETIGTCQIVEDHVVRRSRQSSNICQNTRVLVAGSGVTIPGNETRDVAISWNNNPRTCSEQGHYQQVGIIFDDRLSCPLLLIPFFDWASVKLTNTTNKEIEVTIGQRLFSTQCVSTTMSVEALINRDLQLKKENAAKKLLLQKQAKLAIEKKEEILYAKGYLYPMSPSLLKPAIGDEDDDIEEVEVNLQKDCKKSCLSKGCDWETFCTSCAQYMLLTINANILPTDGSYVTVLCRLVGPFIDDVDECPKCIAIFPSTTSRAIFQVIPAIREVLFCGNSAFAYVTISTRSRGVLDDRELVSGTLLGFGQKRTKEESQVGDGQCLWPLKLALESADSPPIVVDAGQSVKVRATFSVPEAHKFDPVCVEFALPFEKMGNEDRNFLLQGRTDLLLPFVNKPDKTTTSETSCSVELKHGAFLGNVRLLSNESSVQIVVMNRVDLPTRPVRFVDTNGRTSCLRPVVASQNVSVLKNSHANVLCRVAANEHWSDWDVGLRHVILIPQGADAVTWEFKSRLITENAVENSDKFYVQLHNRLKVTNHLRMEDPIATAKIYVGLDRNARYEIFKIVGRIPVQVSPGGLFTLHCELVRWSGFTGKSFKIHSGLVEVVSIFDLLDSKNIDLMSEAVIIETVRSKWHSSTVYFQLMARNDSDQILKPQFVEVGLARGLTINGEN